MYKPPITPARLIAARNVRATHIVSFLKCISSFPGEVVWVFEGKDVKYYGSRIKDLLGCRPQAVVAAGGKSKVLDILGFAEANPDLVDIKFACFVDKDFDSTHPTSHNLYVTPCYSIENLYVTNSAIESILQTCFDLHSFEHENTIRKILRIVSKWRKTFIDKILELNAWIFIQKSKPEYALRLNTVGIDKLLDIKFKDTKLVVSKKYTIKKLNEIFPKAAKVNKNEVLDAKLRHFNSSVDSHIIRGKYLAEFLFYALGTLIKYARDGHAIFSCRRTVTLNPSKVNIISELCAFADTPPCLRSFILRYA